MNMAETEVIAPDRKTMRKILRSMEEAVREDLSENKSLSQIDLILDKKAQKPLRQSEKDLREERTKPFKTAKALLADLPSPA